MIISSGRRRDVAVAGLVTALALGLAACSSSSSGSTATASPAGSLADDQESAGTGLTQTPTVPNTQERSPR